MTERRAASLPARARGFRRPGARHFCCADVSTRDPGQRLRWRPTLRRRLLVFEGILNDGASTGSFLSPPACIKV